MSIPGSASPLLLASTAAAAAGYQVSRSLRFNAPDSAFLSRTPAVAGNRRTWTWAGWVKKPTNGATDTLFGHVAGVGAQYLLNWSASNEIDFYVYTGSFVARRLTTQVFRDPSAWYHIVAIWDTTNATASNRMRLYINGTQITTFSSSVDPSPSFQGEINNTVQHGIGNGPPFSSTYLNGYLADIHFIDGQALTPSSFTEVSATTGQLIPKTYTGTYGTNGFQLKFADNSSNTATTLGKDTSGNSNNWTPNNLSVTAGAGNDSLVDTPTSYGTDTGAGGEVRGNYCTWNPLAIFGGTNATKSYGNGNLEMTATSSNNLPTAVGTIAATSGKWYAEVTAGHTNNGIGFVNAANLQSVVESSYGLGSAVDGWIRYDYRVFNNSTTLQSGLTNIATNDIVQIALDLDNGKFWFGINNTWDSGNPATGTSPTATFTASNKAWLIGTQFRRDGVSVTTTLNAGQRAFAYTAPSGFKALCDTNLGAPLVAKGNTVMDAVIYTGNGSTQTISGLNFSPDLVWLKSRSGAFNHRLVDQVQGNTSTLASNLTTAAVDCSSDFTGFTASGFSVSQTASFELNNISHTYVAWAWDAGSSTVSNPDGSITSQVRANVSAGFSVVTYTASGTAGATIGHGLGVAPQFIIVKNRDYAQNWFAYHVYIGGVGGFNFNTTDSAYTSDSGYWNNTNPSSSLITLGTYHGAFGTHRYVAYAFVPVVGYSSFGSYTGNGVADGPFVYTGFRPRFVLIRQTNGVDNWQITDTAINSFNVVDKYLLPNTSDAEATYARLDILSNGFKLRLGTYSPNSSGGTFIYAAFAENPFQYARAR